MIHQAGKIKDKDARKKFLEWLWDLEFNIYKIPVPDKIFFLNMPIDCVEKLIQNRKNKFDANSKKDIHESDERHLIESREAAVEVARDYNWIEIKCALNGNIRTREDISKEIFSHLEGIV